MCDRADIVAHATKRSWTPSQTTLHSSRCDTAANNTRNYGSSTHLHLASVRHRSVLVVTPEHRHGKIQDGNRLCVLASHTPFPPHLYCKKGAYTRI